MFRPECPFTSCLLLVKAYHSPIKFESYHTYNNTPNWKHINSLLSCSLLTWHTIIIILVYWHPIIIDILHWCNVDVQKLEFVVFRETIVPCFDHTEFEEFWASVLLWLYYWNLHACDFYKNTCLTLANIFSKKIVIYSTNRPSQQSHWF